MSRIEISLLEQYKTVQSYDFFRGNNLRLCFVILILFCTSVQYRIKMGKKDRTILS